MDDPKRLLGNPNTSRRAGAAITGRILRFAEGVEDTATDRAP